METKHKGALAELRAMAWLIEQGYEVFRNVSQHGLADLVAWHPATGELLKIDVKSHGLVKWTRANGTKMERPYNPLTLRPSPEQEKAGVRILSVSHTGFCQFVPV